MLQDKQSIGVQNELQIEPIGIRPKFLALLEGILLYNGTHECLLRWIESKGLTNPARYFFTNLLHCQIASKSRNYDVFDPCQIELIDSVAVLCSDQLLGVNLDWQADSVLLAIAIEAFFGLEFD